MKKTHKQLLDIAITYTRHRYTELGRKIGCSRQSLHQMKKLNQVPEKYWSKIEKITNGKVKAKHFK